MSVLYWIVVAFFWIPPILLARAWFKVAHAKAQTSVGAWIALFIATGSSLLSLAAFLAPEIWGAYYSQTRYATMSINFFLSLGCAIAAFVCRSEARSSIGCASLALAFLWMFESAINSVV